MKTYIVIMAGGSGTRFWPKSRKSRPKQLLRFFGERTMIEETVARFEGIVPIENILIVTNELLAESIHNVLPSLPFENILQEPIGRNTAPCIGLAAMWIRQKADDQAIMAVFPADHFIRDVDNFQKVVRDAIHIAAEKSIVLLGVRPTKPETGYGYIQYEPDEKNQSSFNVSSFKEKPDKITAIRYLTDKHYLWNAGMFFMRVDTILAEFERQLPALRVQLTDIEKALEADDSSVVAKIFHEITPISIDVGIMENALNVRVIATNFAWSDIGHWDALPDVIDVDEKENVILGEVLAVDCEKSIFIADEQRLIAALGVKNLVVVDSPDAILISARERVQEVRKIVSILRSKRPKLL